MKILIVDDEELARDRLLDLIVELNSDHILLQAENGLIALQLIDEEHPDIVLMDIRMPGMDGLEAAYHLTSFETSPAIIFTTAYQDHAIQAFEANAVDYLLKPIRRERLKGALDKAEIINRARLADIIDKDSGSRARSYLSSSSRGKIELIPVHEISFMKADQKYITVGWKGRELLIDEALKSLEEEFKDNFIRVHRNALVSVSHITALEKGHNDSHHLIVKDHKDGIAVSRRHLQEVRRALKELS